MGDVGTSRRPTMLGSVLAGGGEPSAERIEAHWVEAVEAARGAPGAGLTAELRSLATRLGDRLRLDASRDPAVETARRLADGLGARSERLIDPERMAALLPDHGGPTRLGPGRRSRIESAVDRLAAFVDRGWPSPILVFGGDGPTAEATDGLELVAAEQPLERAVALFDERAADTTALMRAIRVARLELADAYDPVRHDAALERVDWRIATGDESCLLPSVAVLDGASRVRRSGATAIGSLFATGRPIRLVLVERALLAGLERPGEPCPDLAAIAAAYRSLLVVQTTPAVPEHLAAVLRRLAGSTLAGVAIVATASDDPAVPASTELRAAHAGRATPCSVYDPHAGVDWAGRLSLDGNPQPASAWASFSSGETGAPEPFTYVHAVSIHPAFADRLEPVGDDRHSDDQVELAAYLERPHAERGRLVPFITLDDGTGGVGRVLVAPQLVAACEVRAESWRVLQELAGLDNAHVRRARDAVRGEIESAAWGEREALRASHDAELTRVRETAGRAGFERVLHALLGVEPPARYGGEEVAPPPGGAADAPASGPPDALPVTAVLEPVIDSALCTTCNECTNLNPRMFRYNDDKQAYVADPAAGSFSELVRAAERCPARCIHPGAPRPGDRTATSSMLARAEPFN